MGAYEALLASRCEVFDIIIRGEGTQKMNDNNFSLFDSTVNCREFSIVV